MLSRSTYLYALAIFISLSSATPGSSADSPCPAILDHKVSN